MIDINTHRSVQATLLGGVFKYVVPFFLQLCTKVNSPGRNYTFLDEPASVLAHPGAEGSNVLLWVLQWLMLYQWKITRMESLTR